MFVNQIYRRDFECAELRSGCSPGYRFTHKMFATAKRIYVLSYQPKPVVSAGACVSQFLHIYYPETIVVRI